jgi:hypothetical protein
MRLGVEDDWWIATSGRDVKLGAEGRIILASSSPRDESVHLADKRLLDPPLRQVDTDGSRCDSTLVAPR